MTPRNGFTIAELLIAVVVGCVVLGGVYSFLLHAEKVEGRASGHQDSTDTARAIVDHLADALENLLNIPDIKNLIGGPGEDAGKYFLVCTVSANRGAPDGHIERRRYTWFRPTDEGDSWVVELRKLDYSGSTCISPFFQNGVEFDQEHLWQQAPTRTICKKLDDITVLYRPLDDPNAAWRDSWDGEVGKVAVRIRATVGGQTVERVVVPRATALAMMG